MDDTSGQNMETSQVALDQGDMSTKAISSVDSTAVDPTTQGPSASEAEPTSNTGHLPTVRVDDSAAQGVVIPEEEGTSQGNQTTSSIDSEEKLTPNETEDSLVQPGVHVRERELPSQLVGALTNIRVPEGLVRKKNANSADGGAYADIYEGELEQPGGGKTEVAIKCLRNIDKVEKLDRRIRREAFIWAKTNHDNILQFLGYKVVDGQHCLISPWCKHGNLNRYITNKEGIRDSEKLRLLCDAARGLSHLHSLEPVIVHGDIKPDNVLIKDNLEAVLCDFGISRLFFGIGKVSGLTSTGNRIGGTAGYQAKELLEEGSPPTTAGDVYAFGGLILAAMSGENPFHNKRNDAARIVSVCTGLMPSPKDHPRLPKDDLLWDLLRECWSETPEARPVIKTVLQKLETERNRRAKLWN